MTYEEFKTTFPLKSKIKILTRKTLHVVCYHDAEKIVVVRWWRNASYGWKYEVLTDGDILALADYIVRMK